jgi:glucose-1-phosphate adenylyltransferase
MHLRVLSFVLAGGKGTRLYPLTKERAKPAVPFGGQYRIIDFVLSNLVNSGLHSIYVLIQFKSQSLLQHLRDGWEFSGILKDRYIIPVPAQMRSPGETWYRGTADAIFQNVNLIEQSEPHLVAVFGADHVYRMNVREMIEYHEQKRAQATVAAIPVPREQAAEFGVIETAPDGRILAFHEKKADAPTMPGDQTRVLASLTPVKEKEVLLISDALDDDLKGALYRVLRCYIDRLGVRSFNVALYLPPLAPAPEDWSGFPAILRVVDRGDPLNRTADIGAMELYAASVISSDPFRVVEALAKA